jgi:ABC-type transport system substrate-binding protein
MLVGNTGDIPAIGELVQAQLRAVGINATIEPIDIPRFTESVLARGEFELCIFTTSPGSTTNADLKSRWATGGGRNAGRLSNPELDGLIQQQARTFDKADRVRQLQNIQRKIIEQASIIPGAGVINRQMSQPFFKDWETTSADYYEYFNYAVPWLDQ